MLSIARWENGEEGGGRFQTFRCSLTRTWSDLVNAHIPLLEALQISLTQARRKKERAVIGDLVRSLENGLSFSEALETHRGLFPSYYVGLIRAGEQSGNLGGALTRLADFLEEDAEFQSQLRSSLAYPLFIAVLGGITVFGLFLWVVPKILVFFQDLEVELPWPTRLVLFLSQWAHRGLWLVPLALVAWNLRKKFPNGGSPGEHRFHRWAPWKNLLLKASLSRYARTLALLLRSGVPFLDAVLIARDSVEDPLLKFKIEKAAEGVERGQSLGRSLQIEGGLPDLFCRLVQVGEETNTLIETLEKSAGVYHRETQRATKTAIALLEPTMILLVGSVIGWVVIALLLPIFSMSTYLN